MLENMRIHPPLPLLLHLHILYVPKANLIHPNIQVPFSFFSFFFFPFLWAQLSIVFFCLPEDEMMGVAIHDGQDRLLYLVPENTIEKGGNNYNRTGDT
jgi:hypothetical protein